LQGSVFRPLLFLTVLMLSPRHGLKYQVEGTKCLSPPQTSLLSTFPNASGCIQLKFNSGLQVLLFEACSAHSLHCPHPPSLPSLFSFFSHSNLVGYSFTMQPKSSYLPPPPHLSSWIITMASQQVSLLWPWPFQLAWCLKCKSVISFLCSKIQNGASFHTR
jgi:hypothetical protein